MVRGKKLLMLAAVLCCGIGPAGCFVTDPLGLVPPGGKNGARIKAEIFETTVAAYVQGVLLFGNTSGIQQEVITSGYTAALLTESILGLEDGAAYERGPAQDCIDAINGAVPFLVAGFLAERQECPAAPADCFVDKKNLSGVAQKTAFWMPLIGCGEIPRTGRIIHVFELSY